MSTPERLAAAPWVVGEVVLALDVGGSELKGAVIAAGGAVLAAIRRPTGAAGGSAAVLATCAGLLGELAALARSSLAAVPIGVGLAVPGIVDETAGVAVFAANLPWRGVPVAAELQSALGLPVVFRHDMGAAGLAEARLGAAQGIADFLFLGIGSGISGALFVAGRAVEGAHGRAGELGHIVVEPAGGQCGCGARGCLETVASAAAIARRFNERSTAGAAPTRGDQPVSGQPSAKEVFELAEAGDAHARAVCNEAVEALAGVLAAYQLTLDPELIVLGGGLSLAGRHLVVPLAAALQGRCVVAVAPRLVCATFGADAGCLGAGLSAWDSLGGVTHAAHPDHGAPGGRVGGG